jgi:transmembrane sensor
MQSKHYQTLEDYLQDPSFRRWILQKIDDQGWEEWLKLELDGTSLAREARLILLALGTAESPATAADMETDLTATWEKIEAFQSHEPATVKRWFPWKLAVAAVLFLGVGLSWHFMKKPKRYEIEHIRLFGDNIINRHNQTKTPLLIILEDGSSVILQPGSELRYAAVFEPNERKVTLTGEAFFEISKNPSRPFFVYANEIVTRVIGTSFRIKAYRNEPNVEVIVRTGKVKVFTKPSDTLQPIEEISLHPNESIRFVRKEATFEKPVIAAPNVAVPIEQLQFDFEDTPVSKILGTIGLAYGLTINYPNEVLKDCYLSTSLSDVPLQQKLKIICESIGGDTKYELNKDQITIFSNGCN